MKLNFPPEIHRLWKLGFAIHWLRPHSKVPVKSGWTSGERETLEELNKSFHRGYNYGVRLGATSRVANGFLAVVDVDIKSEAADDRKSALAKVAELFPEVASGPYLLSGRGNGSRHYYVRLPAPVRGDDVKARSEKIVKVKIPSVQPSKREAEELTDAELADGVRLRPAWEVSILSEGRQAAVVGSIHPDTGERYTWGKPVNGSGKDIPLLKNPLPPGPNSNADASKAPPSSKGPERGAAFALVDVRLKSLPLTKDQAAALVSGRGVTDRSAKVFELCIVLAAAGVADDIILSTFTQKGFYLGACAFDHAKTNDRQRAARWVEKYCLRKAKTRVHGSAFDIEELPGDEKLKDAAERKELTRKSKADGDRERVWPVGFSGQDYDWEKKLELKYRGPTQPPTVKPTLLNIISILVHRAPQKDFVRLEEFSGKTVWQCDTPWGAKRGSQRSPAIEDAVQIKNWFGNVYGIEPANSVIEEALLLISMENRYHAVKDYLEALDWDGTDRISDAFRNYLGATMAEPYLSTVSRKFFLACVKRIYEPGCKFDHVVVLEGKQGRGKSTFASILASEKWFLDGLPNFQDKDAALNLVGTWICELGELATLYKSANESAKAFIARKTDKIRPPYGMRRIDYPRSTVFLGSTNEFDYLTDPTGNRRYWPVKIEQLDFDALERDRDQLWAEALHRYLFSPEKLWLTEAALHQAVDVQETRRVEDEGDAMRFLFDRWFNAQKKEGKNVRKIVIAELFDGIPWGVMNANRGNLMRAGAVLRSYGFEKTHTYKGNVWVRKRLAISPSLNTLNPK